MSALAIDIGTYSIKALSGVPGANSTKLQRVAELSNPLGFVTPSDESQISKLAALLKTFINDNKLPTKDIRIALPESNISTKIISMPPLSDAELASAIGWQAEQHIPIPVDDLSLEYSVLFRPKRGSEQQMRVLMVGVRKQLIDNYMQVFYELGIEPSIMDTQTLAMVRALQFSDEDPASLVLHLGHNSTELAAVAGQELRFVFTTLNGGRAMTQALEQQLGLPADQAEQYKRTYGIDTTQFEGKILTALQPTLQQFVQEIRKSQQYHLTNFNEPIQRVILSGGSAQLIGLVEFFTQQLGIEVLVAAPLAATQGELEVANPLSHDVTVGLLLHP